MTKYFEEIEDTRQQWKIKYLLVEVIVMTIIAVTAGAENWREIAIANSIDLEKFLGLIHKAAVQSILQVYLILGSDLSRFYMSYIIKISSRQEKSK